MNRENEARVPGFPADRDDVHVMDPGGFRNIRPAIRIDSVAPATAG